MQQYAEIVDLAEVIHCRYLSYSEEHLENSIYFRLRGNVEVFISGSNADFLFEQYTKYKKRKSIVTCTTITRRKDANKDTTK